MRQPTDVPASFPSSESRPVLLRALLHLLQEATLQTARLRVGVTAPPRSKLALLADQLESLAAEMRAVAVRT